MVAECGHVVDIVGADKAEIRHLASIFALKMIKNRFHIRRTKTSEINNRFPWSRFQCGDDRARILSVANQHWNAQRIAVSPMSFSSICHGHSTSSFNQSPDSCTTSKTRSTKYKNLCHRVKYTSTAFGNSCDCRRSAERMCIKPVWSPMLLATKMRCNSS